MLGSYLDPLSDKILINALGVSCAVPACTPPSPRPSLSLRFQPPIPPLSSALCPAAGSQHSAGGGSTAGEKEGCSSERWKEGREGREEGGEGGRRERREGRGAGRELTDPWTRGCSGLRAGSLIAVYCVRAH